MDSDSSLDGEFESKHEIAVKLKNSTLDGFQPNNEYESDGASNSSIESSQIESPPPGDKGELSPQSNDGEISKSTNDDAHSNVSSNYYESSDVDTGFSAPQVDAIDNVGEIGGNEMCNKYLETSGEILPAHIVKRDEITGHGEDLSDVSDLDSNDGQGSLDAVSEDERTKDADSNDSALTHSKRKESETVEELEQLDFEADEQQDKEEKEEGECEGKDEKSDDGELKGDDLEEGELTDEDENRPEETEPRPVCRFYNRGQCTWGSSCRFVHPGVTDKGNYTMFDMVRPLVPVNGPPVFAHMDYRLPYEKPEMGTPYEAPRKEPAGFESAWERGLRQAKELMRKSNKRKETDMDFEEKKMNLSLGQEELDKENDYYTRPASPVYKEDERWRLKVDSERFRDESVAPEHYDMSQSPYYRPRESESDYWRHVHYESGDSRTTRVESAYSGRERSNSKYHVQQREPQEFYDKYEKKSSRQKLQSTREVIVERIDKSWRDERYTEVPLPNRRGDEWADPWMRSKSPVGRKSGGRSSRHQSYSSCSSYSSSSGSRSSSQSSYSSYSRGSRSRSQSKSRSMSRSISRSSSRTQFPHGHKQPKRPLLTAARTSEASPPQVLATPPRKSKHLGEPRGFGKNKPLTSSLIQSEKRAASERALLMNPPAPSPRKQKETRPPSPAMMRKSAQNPPPPPPASPPPISSPPATSSRRSKSSQSSSGTDSSGSSSDTSESSFSSSSSSKEPSPKACAHKRSVTSERGRLSLAAESLKVKAMDALKLSGQKQQIKLTLKNTSSNSQNKTKTSTGLPELPELNFVRRDRAIPALIGRKRYAEASACSDAPIGPKIAAMAKPSLKKVTSRREELLKQLKAVEDAIARKRSKI